MKPYCKTFRGSKAHKAKDCSTCSEDTAGGANYARKKGKADVDEGINDYEIFEGFKSERSLLNNRTEVREIKQAECNTVRKK